MREARSRFSGSDLTMTGQRGSLLVPLNESVVRCPDSCCLHPVPMYYSRGYVELTRDGRLTK